MYKEKSLTKTIDTDYEPQVELIRYIIKVYLGAHWFVVIRFAKENSSLQSETHNRWTNVLGLKQFKMHILCHIAP